MNPVDLLRASWALVRDSVRAWSDDYAPSMGAALAYYSLFSMAPLLVIALYLGIVGVGSGFGAAGSLAVLLVWLYYSAQIFLLGAEFTWVYAHRYGSMKGRAEPPPPGPPRRSG